MSVFSSFMTLTTSGILLIVALFIQVACFIVTNLVFSKYIDACHSSNVDAYLYNFSKKNVT